MLNERRSYHSETLYQITVRDGFYNVLEKLPESDWEIIEKSISRDEVIEFILNYSLNISEEDLDDL